MLTQISDLGLKILAVLEHVTRSTSGLHGDTTHTVGRVPINVPMPAGQHSAIARDTERF